MHNSGNLATTIVFADKQLSECSSLSLCYLQKETATKIELLMIKDFFDN